MLCHYWGQKWSLSLHAITDDGNDPYCCTVTAARMILQLHAVIDDWIIPFLAYTIAKTPMLFNGPDNPPKLPRPVRGSQPHLVDGTWAHVIYPPEPHLISSARDHEHGQQADRHVDRPCYSICSNRLHLAIDAMQPKNLSLFTDNLYRYITLITDPQRNGDCLTQTGYREMHYYPCRLYSHRHG